MLQRPKTPAPLVSRMLTARWSADSRFGAAACAAAGASSANSTPMQIAARIRQRGGPLQWRTRPSASSAVPQVRSRTRR